MHCYCYNEYLVIGKKVKDIVFSDEEHYCKEWLLIYNIRHSYDYFTIAFIIFLNYFMKSAIQKLKKKEYFHSRNETMFNITMRMFIF